MSKLVEKSIESKEKTPEEELEYLKNQELWLKEQIKQPDAYLRHMYSSSSPKKDVIVKWAENLERQHELELSLKRTTALQQVGEISTYIKSELRKLGVHYSTFSYVHEVLGYKYKNDSRKRYPDQDDEESLRRSASQSSSNPIAGYFEKENEPIIETINNQIDLLKNFRNKAKSSRILSSLDHTQRLKYEEMNLRIEATQFLADQIIDDRQSVPLYAQLKLIMAVVASTNNFAAGMYVSQVKQFGANKMLESQDFFEQASNEAMKTFSDKIKKLFKDTFRNIKNLRKALQHMQEKKKTKKNSGKPEDIMTSKQAMKIVFGLTKNSIAVFDHHTRDEALMDGFYGIACPECGSYRVREKEHPDSHEWLCFCYRCEWWFESKTISKCGNCHIPLFEEILDVIKKTAQPVIGENGEQLKAMQSKCPRCNKDLILPAKMFEKTKLRGK